MKYNAEIGKIYDTLFFCMEYFYPKEIKKIYAGMDNTSFMFNCFQQMTSQVSEMPDFLSPLFYLKNDRTCPISAFFAEQIDPFHDNIDSFIVKITTQVELLYQRMCQSIFKDYIDSDGKYTVTDYIRLLQKMDVSVEFKLYLSILLGNISYTVTELASTLKQVYFLVSNLYERYSREMSRKMNEIQSDLNLQLYKDSLQYDPVDSEVTIFSLCMLNQYIVFGPYRKDNHVFLMFGYNHEDSLNNVQCDTKINMNEFIISCGNELRLNILHTIKKNGELTATHLSQIFDCPITTVVRHINLLSRSGIIYVSKREGLQIFYKINTMLFKKMWIEIEAEFKKFASEDEERLDGNEE